MPARSHEPSTTSTSFFCRPGRTPTIAPPSKTGHRLTRAWSVLGDGGMAAEGLRKVASLGVDQTTPAVTHDQGLLRSLRRDRRREMCVALVSARKFEVSTLRHRRIDVDSKGREADVRELRRRSGSVSRIGINVTPGTDASP